MIQENKLHVLILENVTSEAELAQGELNAVLKNCSFNVVDTENNYIKALETFKPDLIISDYHMSKFDGLSALEIRQNKYPNIPFIILTAPTNEEKAVECMKAGADDYVIKGHIKRLGQASLNAIEKKKYDLERINNKNKLQESELKYRLLAVNNSDWIFMADTRGKWLYVSPGCEKITGFSDKELLNNRNLFYDMILPEHLNHVLKHFDSEPKLKSSIKDFEFPIIMQNNEVKWISHSCSPVFNDGGNLIGRRGTNRDITKYIQLIKKYKVTQVAAQNAHRIMTLFLANISHEIRTPLTSMLGFTDLIEEQLIESSNEDLKECFDSIKSSGDRLMNTVHGILDLSLIESGNFPHNPKSIQLSKIIETIIAKYKSIAGKKKIKLTYDNQTNDVVISADEGNLIKALSNLIDNAIKFTDEGQVDIKLNNIHDDFVLTITDTGVGIDEDYLNQIFDPFSQQMPDFTVKYQGLGMGMAITKHCLEIDGVSIVIHSKKDVGTTVVLTF